MKTGRDGPPASARLQYGIPGGPESESHCRADKRAEAPPVVILRRPDGGIDVLAEERNYVLEPDDLVPLLFWGHRVHLAGGRGVAWAGPDRRWICFALEGVAHLVERARLVRVLKGQVAAERLAPAGSR